MTALDRAEVSRRRARAGRIREGMKSYIRTLADVAAAWAERDWEVLGYDSWDAYVKEEFDAGRLGLPVEQRQKAVVELRLAGLSQREVASALNVDVRTVRRDERTNAPHELQSPQVIESQPAQTPARRDLAPSSFPETEVVATGELDQLEEVAPEGQPVATSSTEPPAGPTTVAVHSDRPGLDEFVNDDPRVQTADYLVAFASALSRAGGFLQFDAERVGQLAGGTTWDAIEAHASVVAHWYETARKSRSGLRVIKGGVA